MYQRFLRPILFRLYGGDAEAAHELTMRLLATVARSRHLTALVGQIFGGVGRSCELFGLRFPNPVGLAAGMDKDGHALPIWPALGFGFVEVGTVTWRPQPGNPRPRLFRLPADAALINRMGFNNQGAAALAARLAAMPPLPVPLGISLGKSKDTPLEQAVEDYCASFTALWHAASYVAVNISSPNTPGLRTLQDRAQLATLLATLQAENRRLAAMHAASPRPILVKLAPDLSDPAISEALAVCTEHGVAGLIAVNTTLARTGLAAASDTRAKETGGLSGPPLAERARAVVRLIARESGGQLPVIGVGGIASPADAEQMFAAGASLIQLYTGLVYQGPGLPRRIGRAMLT
ncbi:MAG: quinone-dependent dihydroorotate dehydrogenase [Oscillochloridaceae bacterium umkhey_bin13]